MYLDNLERLCKGMNNMNMSLGGAPYHIINGVKHEKDLLNKVDPLESYDLNAKGLIYFIEVYEGETCLFRDYCVFEAKKGLNLMNKGVEERIMLSIFALGMWGTKEMKKQVVG